MSARGPARRGARAARRFGALSLALAFALLPARAHAQGAPADSALERYVRTMADSTDAYFGLSAQAPDTTGLDSLRAFVLAHPRARRGGTRLSPSFAPQGAFNRALGPVGGANAGLDLPFGFGGLEADAQWAGGADLWLGGGSWTKRWNADEAGFESVKLRIAGGRQSASMDRDFFDPVQSSLRAFLTGSDRSNYVLRDGAEIELSRRKSSLWAGLLARDQLESPLPTTASWYLGHHGPVVFPNDTARAGRTHELSAWLGGRVPNVPVTLEARGWTAGGALGGALAYTRVRLSAGGAFGLGRHLALVPEADWGRLHGSALPQDAFDLGGSTLRSLDAESVRGTGRAAGHVDLLVTDAVQTLLGFDREPTFPIQIGAFAGSAAAWGSDPASGNPELVARDWPLRQEWLSEAGASVLYRPGLPHPDSFVRLDWAIPIGPDGRRPRLYLSYTRSLGFLGGRH